MPASAAPPASGAGLVAPPLRRRLMAFLYEGVLLFGILFAVGLAYAVAVHQTSGIEHRAGLIATCFFVLGLYFVGTWTRGGQTLAMKTWQLRVVTETGAPLTPRQAVMRYLASWLWFLPGFALAGALGPHDLALETGVPLAWVVLYALSSRFQARRQFWHDALCGTAIVLAPPPVART